jgi:predicted Zn-dependent protease with MMP-like domain
MRTPESAILRARQKRFAGLVESAVRGLNPAIQNALRNVAIVAEDEPNEDLDQLGLYEGIPQIERDGAGLALPDRIVLYRLPLERSFPDEAERKEQIRITLLHEIGHHFGLDEARLDQIGLG